MDLTNKKIVKASLLVSFFNGLSLLLGFVNQILIAYYFGTSKELDSYLIAYSLPSLFIGISGTVFSSTLIPTLTSIKNSSEKLNNAIVNMFVFVTIISGILMLFGFIGRGAILSATTNMPQENMALTARLAGLLWLITGISIVTSFSSSIHQFSKKFTLPALIWLLPTIGMILGTIFFAEKIGIIGLLLGALIANIISYIILFPNIFKYFFHSPKITIDTYTIKFLKASIPVSISLMPFTILPLIDAFWASRLSPGSMSYIGYNTRLVTALGTLVYSGIFMVLLPYLSENVEKNEIELFLSRLRYSIKAVLLILIPLIIFSIFYKYQLIELMFKRGMFTEESVIGVSSLFPFYLIGLLGMGPTSLISRGYFAKREYRKFVILSICFIIMYIILSGVLSKKLSYIGIGISFMIYWLLFFPISAFWLEKKLISKDFFKFILKISLISFISVGISYLAFSRLMLLGTFLNILLNFIISFLIFMMLCNNVFKMKTITQFLN